VTIGESKRFINIAQLIERLAAETFDNTDIPVAVMILLNYTFDAVFRKVQTFYKI